MRTEEDSLGKIEVPDDVLYGAQTARSLQNFSIGGEKMPLEIIYALVLIKKAAALTHMKMGLLSQEKADAIALSCDEILSGKYDKEFPLFVWQTGSGTQTNMNVNEVISNLAIEKMGGARGSKSPVHPNDDVNKSQSSNDVFPTAMHIASMLLIKNKLEPALEYFLNELEKKAKEFDAIIKVGRTHLMDAAPLALGQEFSGYASQIKQGIEALKHTYPHLSQIALGATAVGTGLNAPEEFAKNALKILNELTGCEFVLAPNYFEALASNDTMVEVSGALQRLACSFFKIANDIRLMGSGPRAGLAELILPANEPGSSIMPGKVNPTQCEAMSMVAIEVMGNDTAIAMAASQGHFELNVYKPLIAYNLIRSINLLSDIALSFTNKCLKGLKANTKKIDEYLERSLMLATALNTHIGYDKAAEIVKKAFQEDISLKEAALNLGCLDEKAFDAIVDPKTMI